MRRRAALPALLVLTLLFACVARDTALLERHIPVSEIPVSLQSIAPEIEEAILSLDPGSLADKETTRLLSQAPAPRVINLNGSLPVITMDSFSQFLIGMGYPESSVRDPHSGEYSYSSYRSGERLAGMIAWYYEREGMMPVLVGHSQGGMTVLRTLYALSGELSPGIEVWNPLTDRGEGRFHIVDPQGGQTRPVRGLRIGFASAIATGSTMRLLLGQWDMLGRLRAVPDSVEEFTGFRISLDLLGTNFLGSDRYRAAGFARVRDVVLHVTYGHMTVVDTADLAADPVARSWIETYRPEVENPEAPALPGDSARNILLAAELWHSIKKHWCIELQRLIRKKRAAQEG
jgi:hypothetical protein